MPRFIKNRRWTFILTVIAFSLAVATFAVPVSADLSREYNPVDDVGNSGSGGVNIPQPYGAGDPDGPGATGLKYQQRGSVRTGDAYLSSRSAGDSRITRTVWMWRLSVLERVLRVYWIRL